MPRLSPDTFARDMNQILDRVYRTDLSARPGREGGRLEEGVIRARHREGAQALEDALSELRRLREISQGKSAIKDEIDYLRDQILQLQALGEQITELRLELAARSRPWRERNRIQSPDEGRG